MPCKRDRTTKKASWALDSLENAIITLKRENLEKLMKQYKFEPQMIYNGDETGVRLKESEKIIASKRQKHTRNQRDKREKKIQSSDEDSLTEEIQQNLICDDESEYSEEENLFAICLNTGKSGEMWYPCRSCGNWAHKDCSGSDCATSYICSFCLDP